jgi:hypothetical protein
MLQLLTGARLCLDQALRVAHKVLIDTTGFVSGDAAVSLKLQKIDLLRPDLLVAIEMEDELEPILGPIRALGLPEIVKIPKANGVRLRERPERIQYRMESFRRYFDGAATIAIPPGVGFRATRGELSGDPSEWVGRLVSLRGEKGFDEALGVILTPPPVAPWASACGDRSRIDGNELRGGPVAVGGKAFSLLSPYAASPDTIRGIVVSDIDMSWLGC